MQDAEFLAEMGELLRLVEGLEGGNITCACRRVYRVGMSEELRALLPRLRRELALRTGAGAEEVPANGRFALLEVD